MSAQDTIPLIHAELRHLIAVAQRAPGPTDERVLMLEHVLQERGAIPRPSERASERAMRRAKEKRAGEL